MQNSDSSPILVNLCCKLFIIVQVVELPLLKIIFIIKFKLLHLPFFPKDLVKGLF